MIKNAMRIGRLLAFSSLLSIALATPMAVTAAGSDPVAQTADKPSASCVASATNGAAALADSSGSAQSA